MTKYESFTLLISALALTVSLATPAITYYWFDSDSKEYEYRGRFVVVKLNVEKATESSGNEKSVSARVENVGGRPAEGVQISVLYPRDSTVPPALNLYPPTLIEKESKYERAVFYTLARAIAPRESLDISVEGSTVAVYLYTKHGDSLLLYQRGSGNSSGGW